MRNRLLISGLLGVFALSSLTACGSDEPDEPTPASDEIDTESPEPDPSEESSSPDSEDPEEEELDVLEPGDVEIGETVTVPRLEKLNETGEATVIEGNDQLLFEFDDVTHTVLSPVMDLEPSGNQQCWGLNVGSTPGDSSLVSVHAFDSEGEEIESGTLTFEEDEAARVHCQVYRTAEQLQDDIVDTLSEINEADEIQVVVKDLSIDDLDEPELEEELEEEEEQEEEE